jgi:MoxR-like ATPase
MNYLFSIFSSHKWKNDVWQTRESSLSHISSDCSVWQLALVILLNLPVLLARPVVNDTELELSDAGKANADLNGDGVVTHDDLTLLLKTLAKQ